MEPKSKFRQILLSILGIVVLIIAVIGISFAFFSYSKTGTSNNVISTGEIAVAFQEESAINLTNQFPTLDTDAVVSGSNNDVSSISFTVLGYYSKTTGGIDYTIYAVNGESVGGRTNRFRDSEINVKLTPTNGTTVQSNSATNPIAVSELNSNANGKILATGKIQPNTTSQSPQRDSFNFIMYVNDTVRISDTATTVHFANAHTEDSATTYCATARVFTNGAYVSGCKVGASGIIDDDVEGTTLTVYNTLYYSLKLKVMAEK